MDLARVDFEVRGVLDGRPSVARWENGCLHAESELVHRAQVLVAMGEQFETDDGLVVDASLDGGIATALTMMRAFTIVTGVVLHSGEDHSTTTGVRPRRVEQ